MRHAHNAVDLIGKKFGMLTVLARAEDTAKQERRWFCQCDCGGMTTAPTWVLNAGGSKSCGCLRGIKNRELRLTHGHASAGAKSKTYQAWTNMHTRCTNPNHEAYKYYAKRGIKVCERWARFENFLSDMGHAPEGLTLDRINNSGDYEPNNCRWATWEVQANNRGVRCA